MGKTSIEFPHRYVLRSAKRLGISIEDLLQKITDGQKWCCRCKCWHERSAFRVNPAKWDGLHAFCLASDRAPLNGRAIHVDKRGRKASPETRARMAAAHRGDKSPTWKGGITPEYRRARQNARYYEWRRLVFERDGYVCQKCRDCKRRNLQAYHLKAFKDHPELRYELSNGLTVCVDCHKEIHRVEN